MKWALLFQFQFQADASILLELSTSSSSSKANRQQMSNQSSLEVLFYSDQLPAQTFFIWNFKAISHSLPWSWFLHSLSFKQVIFHSIFEKLFDKGWTLEEKEINQKCLDDVTMFVNSWGDDHNYYFFEPGQFSYVFETHKLIPLNTAVALSAQLSLENLRHLWSVQRSSGRHWNPMGKSLNLWCFPFNAMKLVAINAAKNMLIFANKKDPQCVPLAVRAPIKMHS